MSENEQIIVLVSDKGDSGHGEITVVEDFAKAERLMEALIEAGFEQDRIHVFRGKRSEFAVSQRPVVNFADGEPRSPAEARPTAPQPKARVTPAVESAPAAAPAEKEPAVAEPAANAEPKPQAAPVKPQQARKEPAADNGTGPAEESAEQPEAEEAGEPVKFSSLFRSA